MSSNRIWYAAAAAFVVVAGATTYFLTAGQQTVATIVSGSGPVLKFEASGIDMGGFPELTVLVNGQDVGTLVIDTPQRETHVFNVPASSGEISSVEIRLKEETDCKKQDYVAVDCLDRSVSVRSLMVDDVKIENPAASGPRNTPYSIQGSEGGITWNVKG